MLTLLKLIQSIIKTLHSEGTPGQVAAGIALGSARWRRMISTAWRTAAESASDAPPNLCT